MDTIMKIATYARHHLSAGRWAREWNAENDGDSNDYVVHVGSREDLRALADDYIRQSATALAGTDLYLGRMGAAIREAIE